MAHVLFPVGMVISVVKEQVGFEPLQQDTPESDQDISTLSCPEVIPECSSCNLGMAKIFCSTHRQQLFIQAVLYTALESCPDMHIVMDMVMTINLMIVIIVTIKGDMCLT